QTSALNGTIETKTKVYTVCELLEIRNHLSCGLSAELTKPLPEDSIPECLIEYGFLPLRLP
ncbi:MAG: hypothetical protein IKJ45_00430, partial [Kiritimatiellae bacterium]|nr:hypothetical protein [Kiritimatiellia bacterium]